MKIKINQDYYETGKKIFPYRTIELNPGITVLVGCNGSGKTTLLQQIDNFCRKNSLKSVRYDNFKEGGYNATNSLLLRGDMSSLILDITSSEGERVYYNVARLAPNIKHAIEDIEPGKPLFLLLDGIDSGMDVATIESVKTNFLNAAKTECEKAGITPYIVVSANSYETAREEQCLSLLTGKYVQIRTYDKYKNIVKKTYERKLERYANE